MSSLGRPARVRAIHGFHEFPVDQESVIAIDTSFVVRALHPLEANHEECVEFLHRIAAAEATLVFNELLNFELIETAYKLAVMERHGRKAWPSKRGDGRVRRRATRLAQELMESWDGVLSVSSYVDVPLADVSDSLITYMSMGLSSYDAAHAASATLLGADALATTDRGFSRIPESQLSVVTTSDRAAGYRRNRARAAKR